MKLTTLHLSSSGRKVTCRAAGDGPPLVLIHGVGMQSAAWGPQIASLSRTHRVIAVDMPGHGSSDPLPTDSRLPEFVDWCGDVVRSLNLGPVNLAGHSMGALIAGGFAVEYPALTQRVALLNAVFRRDAKGRANVIARADEIRAGKVDFETPLSRWFSEAPADQTARAQVAGWLQSVDPEGYGTAYTAFAHGDATYADRFSEIQCPFLALTGDGDPNSTAEMSVAMAKAAQDGQSQIIEGHRHMVNLTAPDQVSDSLAGWLQRQSATTSPT